MPRLGRGRPNRWRPQTRPVVAAGTDYTWNDADAAAALDAVSVVQAASTTSADAAALTDAVATTQAVAPAVADTAAAADAVTATLTPPALLQTGFEAGPNGTAIPLTGANGGDAFTAAGANGTGASAVYDNTIPAAAADGSYVAKLTSGTATAVWRGWTFTPATGVLSCRMYLYVTAAPNVTTTLISAFSGGAQQYRLLLTSALTIQHANGGTFSGTSAAAVALNTLTRIECTWNIPAQTFVADVYTGHSTTPKAGGIGLTAQTFAASTIDEARLGIPQGQPTAFTIYTDGWGVIPSSTRIGPIGTGTNYTTAPADAAAAADSIAGQDLGRAVADDAAGTDAASTVQAQTTSLADLAAAADTAAAVQGITEALADTAAAADGLTAAQALARTLTDAAGATDAAATAAAAAVSAADTAAATDAVSSNVTTAPLAETAVNTFDAATGLTLTAGATVTGGELVLTPTSAYPRATLPGTYTILGSHFGGRLTQRAVGSSANVTILRVAVDPTNSIELSVSQTGGVGATLRVNGSVSDSFNPGMIANATHYRIKVASDRTVTWQAMVSGVWFTIRVATPPVGWNLAQVQLVVMAGLTDPATNSQPAKWTSVGVYNDVAPALTNTAVDFGVAPTTTSSPPLTSEIDAYQGVIGRKPHLELWYRAWTNTITATQLEQVRARGNISLLTWEAWDFGGSNTSATYNLANITAGNFDAYITATATTMKQWGGLLYLRPLHEMNHTAYPWCVGVNGNAVGDFIPAWQHIVDIFRSVGASNVRFVWCPNQIAGVNTLAPLYPGDSYVDVVAADAYNFGGATYTWPANVFDGTLNEIRAITTTKPLWIGETSASPTGGDKAQWVSEFFDWVRLQTNADVRAFCWFDVNKENDWTVNSTVPVQNAFTAGLATLGIQYTPFPADTAAGTDAVADSFTKAAADAAAATDAVSAVQGQAQVPGDTAAADDAATATLTLGGAGAATISFVGAASDTSAAQGSTSSGSTLPSGIAAGDLIVLAIERNVDAALTTTPAGYTFLRTVTDVGTSPAAANMDLYTRVADGTEGTAGPAVAASAAGGTTFWIIHAAAYRGVDTANPFISESGQAHTTASSTAHAAPAIANTSAGAWAVFAGLFRQVATPSSWTPPTGMTARLTTDRLGATTTNPTALWADTAGTVAPGTVTYTGTSSAATAIAVAWAAFLRPATITATAYNASPADAAGLADAVATALATSRTAADIAGAADAAALARGVVGALTDTAAADDAATSSQTLLRTIADSAAAVDVADAILTTGATGYTASPADVVGATDTVSAVQVRQAVLSDSAAAADATSATLGVVASAADLVAAADSVATVATYSVTVTDAAGATDTATVSRAAVAADVAAGADAAASAQTQQAALSDTAGATDAVTVNFSGSLTTSAADTAAAVDSIAAVSAAGRTVADTAAATDTLSASFLAQASATDAAGVTDAAGTSQGLTRQAGDAAGAADAVTLAAASAASSADSAAGADAAAVQQGLARAVADAAGLTDTVTADLAQVGQVTAADALAAVDSAAMVGRSLTATDTAAATDAVGYVLSAVRTPTDVAMVTDTAVISQSRTLTLADALGAVDAATGVRSLAGIVRLRWGLRHGGTGGALRGGTTTGNLKED